MTPQQLYQKVLNEEMSQSQFLFQIRRDDGLSSFITNTNTYDQTIVQLKNRGHIFDINEAKEESFDLLGSIKVLTEATKKPKLDQDHANDYEFQQGWRYELDDMKEPDIDKAREKALKNIESDPIYYTRLLLLKTKKPTKRTDQPIEINASKTNVVDKDNAVKPVKGIEKDKTTPKGSAEKATKPKGVKTMKGGPGEMKTIGEGFDPKIKNIASIVIKNSDSKTKEEAIQIVKQEIKKGNNQSSYDTDVWKEVLSYLKSGEVNNVGEGKNPFPGNKLKGGKGDKLSINDVDRVEFKKGIKHEMEHTTDPKIAAEIALDHLAENPKYYSELDKTGIDESIFSSVDKPVKGKEVSFTVEDHSDPNKKLQIKKTVKSGKKSKDGTFELSFTQGDKLTMTKTNQGVTSLYFENPSDAKIHDKVVDLDKGLATLADKIFPKEKAVDEENVSEALRESLKKIIRKKLYEQDIKGPTVKKNELNDLMKRYDWYYETSDNESLKKRGQETHDKAMDLVNQLGDTGIEVFNSYAPDDCKITKSVNEGRATKKITVLADDAEGTIENILKALQGRGNGGHSFSVTVDEDGEDGGDKFGWDGDGSDYIEDIKVETLPKDDKK